MATFYPTLGSKKLEELPKLPTNLVLSGGTGAIKATWTNNNTLTGCTNQLQYWNGSTWVSGATVASSATTATKTGLSELVTYNARVAVKKTSTGRVYSSAVKSVTTTDSPYPLTGLVGRWQFEDTLNDDTATYAVKMEWYPANPVLEYKASGKVGKALGHSSSTYGDAAVYIDNATIKSLLSGTNTYSLSIWTNYPDNVSTDSFYFNFASNYDGNTGPIGYRIQSNGYQIWMRTRAGAETAAAVVALPTGWNHFVMTFDGTTSKLYVNNVLKLSDDNSSSISSNTNFLMKGRINTKLYYANYYDDCFYIYNRALNTTEIAKLYNSGNGI